LTPPHDLRSFEEHLDAAFERRAVLSMSPADVIDNAVGAIGYSYMKPEGRGTAHRLELGLHVALPRLIDADKGAPFELEPALKDLVFLSHYYLLRDYLYFSYNAPESLKWRFDDDGVHVNFGTSGIPRTFAQYSNSAILTSLTMGRDRPDRLGELTTLLKDKEEFGFDDYHAAAAEICLDEADNKIRFDFELLGHSASTIQLDGYSYAEFLSVYRYIIAKALYHRYYAIINETWPVFQFPRDSLRTEISQATDQPPEVVAAILSDLTYSRAHRRLQPMYFGLIDHPAAPHYVMSPQRIASSNGLVQLLRMQATRNPQFFLSNVSDALGRSFEEQVASSWREAGFLVATNVQLHRVDPSAPDIDVLVISREPTLAYVAFICELKATLPAVWAKDHLRVLQPDSIAKAFDQINRIRGVLESDGGQRLLWELTRRLDPEPLAEGLIPVSFLIVTTQNSGMLLEDLQAATPCKVIDHSTLRAILSRCDGDVAYVLHMIRQLDEIFGAGADVTQQSFDLDGLAVTYDVVGQGRVVSFPENVWRSDGQDKAMAEQFYRDGGSPFDVLKDRLVEPGTAESDESL